MITVSLSCDAHEVIVSIPFRSCVSEIRQRQSPGAGEPVDHLQLHGLLLPTWKGAEAEAHDIIAAKECVIVVALCLDPKASTESVALLDYLRRSRVAILALNSPEEFCTTTIQQFRYIDLAIVEFTESFFQCANSKNVVLHPCVYVFSRSGIPQQGAGWISPSKWISKNWSVDWRDALGQQLQIIAKKKPGDLCPSYLLGRRLGSGSYGDVFKVHMLVSRGVLAVKRCMIGNSEDPSLYLSVRREIEILAALDHPNIMKLSHWCIEENWLCVFLELCDLSLSEKLMSSEKMTDEEICRTTRGLLLGVLYIHDKGYVHGDLKPSNILFRDGVVKISDLGTAMKLTDTGTCREMRGTFAYMSPEVVVGTMIGKPSDIWSIGCIFAELLGVPVSHFSKLSLPQLHDLYTSMKSNDFLQFTANGKPLELPKAVGDLLFRCFQRDPQRRATASELLSHPVSGDVDWVRTMRAAVRAVIPLDTTENLMNFSLSSDRESL
jgi:serine/threonine protein kinase